MGLPIDIVLIKANNQKRGYQNLSEDFTGIEPPLWLAVTAAYLREQGGHVAVLDAEAENLAVPETVAKIISYHPRMAAVLVSGTNPSASTINMPGAGEVLKELKRVAPEIPTAISGLHPSALPERTMQEECADFLVQGEGLPTFWELIKALRDGKKVNDELVIKGLWYRQGAKVASNPRAPNVLDLGTLPMAAWDLLPMGKYRAHNWHCFDDVSRRQPYAVIYTSLGCPFNCSFCCINSVFGGPGIRYRPADKVAQEVDYLVKTYGVRHIKVLDEIFALKPSHVFDFCERMIALGHNLNFWVYGRIDTINEKMLAQMKRAGVNWLAYGIEAGSKKVREAVSKGRFDEDQIRRAVKMTHEAGINIVANFIFGLPEDDLETMQETLVLAQELNCAYANFYCAMAYPGSQLYEEAIRQNLPLPKTWGGYSQFGEESFPLSTKYLTGGQVLRFRDEAFIKYYRNPRYLKTIEEKFGVTTLEHIKRMCSIKLKRKYYDGEGDSHFHCNV
jgi:anaerobic magnesium-protoporphyrin IX monomethyl ester cyclase